MRSAIAAHVFWNEKHDEYLVTGATGRKGRLALLKLVQHLVSETAAVSPAGPILPYAAAGH
jgi:hypothetical protein